MLAICVEKIKITGKKNKPKQGYVKLRELKRDKILANLLNDIVSTS